MEDMNFSATTEFTIPVVQIIFFMFSSTFCFLLRKYKLGLMTSFAFVFYWGFIHSSSSFVDMMGSLTLGFFVYLFSGFLIITLALVGFVQEKDFCQPSH
jgi:hypothetical protein